MSVDTEKAEVTRLFRQVSEMLSIADSLGEGTPRRRLCTLADELLDDLAPVRPSVAAAVLGLSRPTVSRWAKEGVLTTVHTEPRVELDPARLLKVALLVERLREAGKATGLLDAVYRRLNDAAWLNHPDLAESLEQVRRGEVTVVRTAAEAR